MPQYTAPGVVIEESGAPPHQIDGVSTGVCLFVGPTLTAPASCAGGQVEAVESGLEFEQRFGGLADIEARGGRLTNYVAYAAHAFFDNGGRRLYVARVAADASTVDYAAALEATRKFADVSIVAAPGYSARPDALAIQQVLLDHVRGAHENPARFAVLDAPPDADIEEALAVRRDADSSHAAIYHPWVAPSASPESSQTREVPLPPSGFVCGIYARSDEERGVWKPPANQRLAGVQRLAQSIDARTHETLNAAGVNCLRSFPDRGVVVWGARTMSSDPEWKYVNVRRYITYLERSIYEGLQWALYEANDERLWDEVRRIVWSFLHRNWMNGALLGSTAEEAYFVRCDRTTMTQADIDAGRLIVLIGVATARPAEFVIVRIGLRTAARCEEC